MIVPWNIIIPPHTNRGCCFSGKIEASEVGVAHTIVDKAVTAETFIGRDCKVGTGIQVYEIEHVEHGFQKTQCILQSTSAGI